MDDKCEMNSRQTPDIIGLPETVSKLAGENMGNQSEGASIDMGGDPIRHCLGALV